MTTNADIQRKPLSITNALTNYSAQCEPKYKSRISFTTTTTTDECLLNRGMGYNLHFCSNAMNKTAIDKVERVLLMKMTPQLTRSVTGPQLLLFRPPRRQAVRCSREVTSGSTRRNSEVRFNHFQFRMCTCV